MVSNAQQRTIITGGAGFIGSHLADTLLARGEAVLCLDNFNDYYDPAQKRSNIAHQTEHPNYTLIEGDIRSRDLILQTVSDYQPSRIAHLAAMAGVRYSVERAPLYTDVNIQGTINLLDAARAVNVENFVFASTSSIYGSTEQVPFVETQSTDHPLAPYPATKKAGEVMGYAYHNMFGLNFTALRFFTVYGPRVRPDMMAYMVIDRILNDREIVLYNGGEMHRDWTFVEDIIQGVVAALDKPFGYEVLNIGRGEPVHLGEFVAILQDLVGKEGRITSKPAPASEPPITYANTQKAQNMLGYRPQTSISEGLARTWAWYQQFHGLTLSADE